jgi:hypothetical protein
MTRLQKALEKAARSRLEESPTGPGDLNHEAADGDVTLGIRSFAEEVQPERGQPEISRPTVTHSSALFVEPINAGPAADPITVAKISAITCPGCGSLYEGPQRGSRMRWFLALVAIPPYRCGFCRRRFRPSETQQEDDKETLSIFLRPEDDRSFQDFIRDLARDERKETAHSFGPNERLGRR